MVRPKRPDFYHSYHHIVIRGVDGLPIFDSPKKRCKFIELMKDLRIDHDLSIYAIGFLDNHVHLFVRRNNHSMARFFQRLKETYTQWYNSEYKRTGTLYDGRYFSNLVDQDRYFHAVWLYVHHQSVSVGLYDDPLDDPWNTARCYKENGTRFDWIDWEEALELLPIKSDFSEVLECKKEVQRWLADGLPIERHREQDFIASDEFIEKYMQIRKAETRQAKRKESPLKWNTLMHVASDYFKLPPELMLENSKKRRINKIRCLLAWAGRAFCHLSVSDLADQLNVGESTISEMIKRARNKYVEELEQWQNELKGQGKPEI